MTDKVKGFTVILNQDVTDEETKRITEAVELIQGVAYIDPMPASSDYQINISHLKIKVEKRLKDRLKGKLKKFIWENLE